MYTILSKSEGAPFQISFFWGDLTWNDPMLKNEYSKAIMSNNPTLIESTKNLYIASQKRHREAIEQANQDAIEKSTESITHNGNTDMDKFWKIRKNMLSKRQETYDTLDTDNQPITDPERAKEHIANFLRSFIKQEKEKKHTNNGQHT